MPCLRIGGLVSSLPIVQGGMGVGVSLSGLASAVADAGGIGVIATAGIGHLEPDFRSNMREANRRALKREIRDARALTDGPIGVNIMVALSDFDDLVTTALEEDVDALFLSAGLPLRPPRGLSLQTLWSYRTKIIPKVSSPKAAALIFRYWADRYGRVPDAVVIEGPRSGGHQGFTREQIANPAFALENLVPAMLKVMRGFEERFHHAIPVIAAGGVFTGQDIRLLLQMGVAGVKMGTRFVGTHECDAHDRFKQAYMDCGPDDLSIIDSPVGLPGRAIANRFLRDVAAGARKPYECLWKCLKTCDVRKVPYCIAHALMSAKEGRLGEGFAFAGANAYRVNEIVSVQELMGRIEAEYARVRTEVSYPRLAVESTTPTAS